MNFNLNFINDQNKSLLQKTRAGNAVYFSQINEPWQTNNALRTFSVKMVLEGALFYEIKTQKVDLNAGCFIIAAAQPDVKAYNKQPVKTLCIDLDPELIVQAMGLLHEKDILDVDSINPETFLHPNFNDCIYSSNAPGLGEILRQIIHLVNDPSLDGKTLLNNELCFELVEQLVVIERENSQSLKNLRSIKESTRRETLYRLQLAKLYMDKNFLKNPQIQEIAVQGNMSEFHFFRTFKQAFGITPYRYLLRNRLLYSQKLLAEKIAINKVAFLCGFPDSSTYSKAFKKNFGASPTRYADVC